jgi:hypothetical protein
MGSSRLILVGLATLMGSSRLILVGLGNLRFLQVNIHIIGKLKISAFYMCY